MLAGPRFFALSSPAASEDESVFAASSGAASLLDCGCAPNAETCGISSDDANFCCALVLFETWEALVAERVMAEAIKILQRNNVVMGHLPMLVKVFYCFSAHLQIPDQPKCCSKMKMSP